MRDDDDLSRQAPAGDPVYAPPCAPALPEPAIAPLSPARGTLALLWPFFLLLVMGLLWGATVPLAKLATQGGAHPLGLTFWQGAGGAAITFVFCLIRRRLPSLQRAHVVFYLFCGLIGSVIPGAMLFYAAPHLPAGIIAITLAAVPLMTYGASFALRLDRLTPARLLGILLGLLGVLLIVGPESSLPDRAMVGWVFLSLTASAFYTLENIFVTLRRPPGSDSLALVCGMLAMSAIYMLPVVWLTDSFVPLGTRWGVTEFSVLGMMVFSALAYALFLYVIETSGPVFASQTAYIITIAGVFWGILIFDERHSWWIWAALAVMIAGLALVTPKEKKAGL